MKKDGKYRAPSDAAVELFKEMLDEISKESQKHERIVRAIRLDPVFIDRFITAGFSPRAAVEEVELFMDRKRKIPIDALLILLPILVSAIDEDGTFDNDDYFFLKHDALSGNILY